MNKSITLISKGEWLNFCDVVCNEMIETHSLHRKISLPETMKFVNNPEFNLAVLEENKKKF